MAREMSEDRGEIFRVVLTEKFPQTDPRFPGAEKTHYYGPFSLIGAAKAASTRENRRRNWLRSKYAVVTETKVQRAETKWEDVK